MTLKHEEKAPQTSGNEKTLANSGSWEHKARAGVGHPLPGNELVDSIISNQ